MEWLTLAITMLLTLVILALWQRQRRQYAALSAIGTFAQVTNQQIRAIGRALVALNAKSTEQGQGLTTLILEVESLSELNEVLRSLKPTVH
jgi:hypothetical protein